MSPTEFWWEADMRMEEKEEMERATKGGAGSKFTSREWADARRRHMEKLNGRR